MVAKELEIFETSSFRKDIRRAQKRRKDLGKLKAAISILVRQEPLPAKYKDHPLTGNWRPCRDCHIEPDWLLIYEIDKKNKTLILNRTGTHSDLFKKKAR